MSLLYSVMYFEDAQKRVEDAIQKVNASQDGEETVEVGLFVSNVLKDEYASTGKAFIYLCVSSDQEGSKKGRAALYFDLQDEDGESIGGGIWTDALNEDSTPIPQKRLASVAKDCLDECQSQIG